MVMVFVVLLSLVPRLVLDHVELGRIDKLALLVQLSKYLTGKARSLAKW